MIYTLLIFSRGKDTRFLFHNRYFFIFYSRTFIALLLRFCRLRPTCYPLYTIAGKRRQCPSCASHRHFAAKNRLLNAVHFFFCNLYSCIFCKLTPNDYFLYGFGMSNCLQISMHKSVSISAWRKYKYGCRCDGSCICHVLCNA